MEKETREKINQLQLLEKNLQNSTLQRQHFQSELTDIDNALKEISTTKKEIYKIIGNIMLQTDKEKTKKELEEKKEITSLRIKTLEKQEKDLKNKASSLKEEVMKQLE